MYNLLNKCTLILKDKITYIILYFLKAQRNIELKLNTSKHILTNVTKDLCIHLLKA